MKRNTIEYHINIWRAREARKALARDVAIMTGGLLVATILWAVMR